ncbi:pentapeptide repeat-containing protein, partial [Myxococcota bacterium]|nr:pentapeptide repeat-containing protein [Myxococcota bacterium]
MISIIGVSADVWSLNQQVMGLVLLILACGVQGAGAENTDLSPGLDARGTDHTAHHHANQILTAVDLSAEPGTGTSARLDQADFSNADLSLADLSQVNALQVVGVGLVLDGARLSGGQWNEANLSGADLSFVSGSDVDFSDAVMVGATLEFSNLRSSSFIRADLSNVQATDASWINSDLTGAKLIDADLAGAGLRDSVLVTADLTGARLFLADLSRVDARCEGSLEGNQVGFEGCPRFDGVDLSFASLVDAQFSFGRMIARNGVAVDLEESDLTRANFSDACFTVLQDGVCQSQELGVTPSLAGADLDGVIFDRAFLGGADLSFARGDCVAPQGSSSGELTQCPSFVGTDARFCVLRQTRLVAPIATGWILHGADLTAASLTGLRDPCDLPATAAETPVCLEFFSQGAGPEERATLRKINLSTADIAGVNFSDLDLESARLDGVDGYRIRTGTNGAGEPFEVVYQTSFSGANLAGASLVGADLEQADLSNVDLSSADLSNATLTGAILAGVSAANAILDGVILECDTPPCQTLSGFSGLTGSSWVGAGLEGQDLSDLNLAGIDLRSANLQGTIWNRAILTDADLSGQDISDLDLSEVSQLAGARLDNARLTCAPDEACDPLASASDLTGVGFQKASLAGVSFRNRNLAGANFRLADLSGADLTGSTATDANFSGSSLGGVSLTGVNLEGAWFDSTNFACSADAPCTPFLGAVSLAGARFRSAGLSYVRFEGTEAPLDLNEADFSQANLTGAQFLNVSALGARFDLLTGVCSGGGA